MKSATKSGFIVFILLTMVAFGTEWCNPIFATAEEGAAGEEKYGFYVGGYVRTWASFNLQDQPETEGYNDRYKASMLRGSLQLDCDAKAGPLTFKVIGRGDQEIRTDYLTHLQEMNQTGMNVFGSKLMRDSPGTEIMDQYNQGEFREYYVEFDPVQRVKLRLGRQQVVWGETDFFRAMDVVHGFDYRWRFFMEPENEELRKPLLLANAMIQAPELGGSLQLIYRPGWDRPGWIGNTFPLAGGRWNPQPTKSLDILAPVKYDYDYPDGDTDDATWGARWSGIAGPINYSFAYLKTFNNDPLANPGIREYAFENKETAGTAGDLVYPKIELVGVTASGYAPWIDAVLSTEVVYTFDEPFNRGSGGPVDSLAGTNAGPPVLGKEVANAIGPGMDWVNRTFGGRDPNALIGLVERVLKPQGLTDDQLWNNVLPALQAIYHGGPPPDFGQMTPTQQATLGAQLAALGPALGQLYSMGLLQPNPTGDWGPGRENLMNTIYNFHTVTGYPRPLLVDWIPGLHGIEKKDSLMLMLRMDKKLAFTQQLLGTGEPAFFSVQVFNHVILDYHREDDIVRMMTYGEHRKEIETMVTGVLNLNYLNQRINPTLAGGWDASYGGLFFFPSVEFAYGDHWRLRLEADFFFPSGAKDPATVNESYLDLIPLTGDASGGPYGRGSWWALGNMGINENSTSFLGYFANNDQFLIRLTYQF